MQKKPKMNENGQTKDKATVRVVYDFEGLKLSQGILTYREFGRVLTILRADLQNLTEETFTETIDRWYERGQLKELFRIILKPLDSNPWQWLRNRWLARRRHIDFHDPIEMLRLDEIALVNRDFFLLNSEYVGHLMLTQKSLELSGVMTKAGLTPSAPMNLSTTSQTETPSKPEQSVN